MAEEERRRFKRVLKEAGDGCPEAMVEAGRMYRDGEGVRKNIFLAWIWFNKGSDHGIGMGWLMAELMVDSLSGREKKRFKRRKWLYDRHDVIAGMILGLFLSASILIITIYA